MGAIKRRASVLREPTTSSGNSFRWRMQQGSAHSATTSSAVWWTRRDPIGNITILFNTYSYLNNDVVRSYDVIGLLLSSSIRVNVIDLRPYNILRQTSSGKYEAGSTHFDWPGIGDIAKCEGCKLILSDVEKPLLIEVIYFSLPNNMIFVDRFNRKVEEHEAVHVDIYTSYWEAFTEIANKAAGNYKNERACLKRLQNLGTLLLNTINAANNANEDYDKRSYR